MTDREAQSDGQSWPQPQPDNLVRLLIDERRVDFDAAAMFLADESADDYDPSAPSWTLLVTNPKPALPRGEMAMWAIARSGAIYVGRGRWKFQAVTPSGQLLTDAIEGLGDLAVGNMSQLDARTVE